MRHAGSLLLAILCAGGLTGANVIFDNAFGATQFTNATAIALDSQGNVYVTGSQSPSNNGLGAAFVSKWSPDGSQLLYTTSFGGSGLTVAEAIAVDSMGSAYIAGHTTSQDFPVTSNAFQQNPAASSGAFVTKLSPDGSKMVYSMLLGGAQANGIAVDSAGNAIVTGAVQGTDFPVTPNAFQTAPVQGCSVVEPGLIVSTTGTSFVTKIAPDGASLVYSTLLGGSCATLGQAIALDASGNAWVTGMTGSPDFPVTSGAIQPQFAGGGFDGYLAQFTAAGNLAYASYLGGDGYDTATGIALDRAGNIYVAGVSNGLSQAATSGSFQPSAGSPCGVEPIVPTLIEAGAPFVIKLAPGAATVSGLTYLGGGCADRAVVAVDGSGSAWIAGSSYIGLTSIPTVSPFQIGGPGFVGKFSPDFTRLLFSTYFETVNGLTLDSSGLADITGIGPTTTTQAGFVAKVEPAPPQISLDQVLSTGSFVQESNLQMGVAPGEVLRLIGRGIGPNAVTPGIVNSAGFVTTSVAGVQVTFGGIPAPLLSVSANEIDCVAPFEILSQAVSTSIQSTTSIQVQYNGVQSNPVQMSVEATAVEVLAVLNPNGTLNSPSNPAQLGVSTMAVYLAGVGQTNPPSQDGQVNQFPLAQPGIPIQLQFFTPYPSGGAPPNTQITYAGAAPGLIAGILQVNFSTPEASNISFATVQAPGSSTSFPVSTYFINPSPGP